MANANPDTCPRCGTPRSPDAPAGLCPRCLLGQALGVDGIPSESPAPEEPARVLDTLTATSGPMPRVLLTDQGEDDDGPLVRPASQEIPPPAERPARVQLLGEIARGGMGAVLKGRDPDLGRDLAVKVLLEAHRDTPELVRRFVEEAQIGGQLQHPGVVPVYELGTFGRSRPYFTMKLVKGRTLAELLGDRAAPGDDLPRFLAIFEQIAQTVAYAHARGVIHRDLKPSNVMVGGFGEVQVMDWGLAKVLPRGGVIDDREAGKTPAHETVITTARSAHDAPDLSLAGSVLGTPAYMAPEQARGEIDRLDERCDVFALGSIFCEILTGLPAFTGRSSVEMLRRAGRADLADAFGRLESCGADAELVDLARQCLAPEPEGRPAGAREVADRLLIYTGSVHRRMREAEIARAAEAARAEEARRTAEAAEARARAERAARRLQVGGIALALALSLVGGLSFIFWYRQRQAGAVRESEAIVESWTLFKQARAAPGDVSRWEAARRSLKEAARAREAARATSFAHERDRSDGLVTSMSWEVDAGLAAAQRDRRLLDRLREIRFARDATEPARTAAAVAYTAALREYSNPPEYSLDADRAQLHRIAGYLPDHGFDIDGADLHRIAAYLRNRPPSFTAELAAALDDWYTVRTRPGTPLPGWRRPLELARLIDPDPSRDHLRAILAGDGPDARRGQLKQLAGDETRVAGLDPSGLTLLARSLERDGEVDAAIRVLRGGVIRHPGNFWLSYDLAAALERTARPDADEVIRFYTVARALRPEAGTRLGHALVRADRDEEAAEVLREVVRLRPDDARGWDLLSEALRKLGRPDEAGRAEGRLLPLQPGKPPKGERE